VVLQLELDVGLTTPHHKKLLCYKMFQSTSDLDWPEGKRPLQRLWHRWEDIKMDLGEIGVDGRS